ncbi:MAG: hypothetical protein OXU74_03945 [Gemmatimonadota bacterium]|nr:hypothetical protein [Gemmatimonadota bacterium]
MHPESGGRLRLDGLPAVVGGRDLDVDASGAPLGVLVLDLRVRVEDASRPVEGEPEFSRYAVPRGVGGPPAVLPALGTRSLARRRP